MMRVISNGAIAATTLVVLAAVIRFGIWRACRTFPIYLAAVAVPGLVFVLFPSTFTWNTWLAKETLQVGIKLAMAAELVFLVFAGLPRARRAAEIALAVVLAATLGLALRAGPGADAYDLAKRLLPLVNDGTAIAYCGILLLAAWYRVPMHPLHRAILRGLAPYLLAFSFALHALEAWGWDVRGDAASYANNVCYLALLGYWFMAVERAAQDDPLPAEVMRELRPWA
jgi:hypothetical protein